VLLEQVAVGGMAEIYLAKTRGVAGFEKLLCLKVIHPNFADDEHFIEMLIDEAKIAVGLNHVNIVQIFDLGRDGKTYYISMEYIDGADLFKIMRRLSEADVDVPIDVAAYVAQEICTGLDYAHRKRDDQGRPLGIIHRDISPQNILISHSGEVKIVDFGIAKAASRSRKTQAGVIKGKYYYMSPEQAWGDPVDQRSDIFSTGIILYEVLTGQMLYLEEDMHRLLDMVRKADIPRPSTKRSEIPPQLENVVMKALAKRPADRWQTAHEFGAALTNFLFSYAPAFTPNRVSRLLEAALGEERAEPARREPRPSTRQVEIASRVDFQGQRREDSVIFRVSDLIPPGGATDIEPSQLDTPDETDLDPDVDEEDRGERTMISGPPAAMMGGTALDLSPAPALSSSPRELEDDGPTLIARDNAPIRPQDMDLIPPRPRRKSRAIPAVEIVVPRSATPVSRAPEVLAPETLPPGDLAPDLTPTPMVELTDRERQPPARERRASVASLRATGPMQPQRSARPPSAGFRPTGAAPPPRAQPIAPPRTAPAVAPVPAPPPAQQARATQPAQQAWPAQAAQPPWPAQPAQPPWPAQSAQQAWSGQEPPSWPPEAATAPSPPAAQPIQPSWPPGQAWPPTAPQPGAAWPAQAPQPAQSWPHPQPQGQVASTSWPYQQPQAPAQPQGWPPAQGATWPPVQPGQGWPQQAQVGWPQTPPAAQGFGGLETAALDGVSGMDAQLRRRRRRRRLMIAMILVFAMAIGSAAALLMLVPFGEEGGIVNVISVPEGASVVFDGRTVPRPTPVEIAVPDTKTAHTVEVNLAGYRAYKTPLSFGEGETRLRVLAVLTPIFGTLVIQSNPSNADVYIDGTHRGKTQPGAPLRIENLSPTADVNLEIRKPRFRPYTAVLKWEGRVLLEPSTIYLQSAPR
jgi:serine/threonine-protein kinase